MAVAAAKRPVVNFIKIFQVVKRLENSDNFAPTSKEELAAKIAEQLGVERKSPDWATIIELILKMLPLILALI